MLILIPILAIIAGTHLIKNSIQPEGSPLSYRSAFMLAVAFIGAFVTVSSEALSLLNSLNRTGVVLSWAILLLVILGLLRGRRQTVDRIKFVEDWSRLDLISKIALGCMSAVVSLLFIIALVSPPNNIDSFIYHMARVVHWAEDESLRHYPAYIGHQLNKPIWSETFILHLRLLWGSDRVDNLMQWFCMLTSVIGISVIAQELGLAKRGQILASLFALAIPMGLLQATSTQNDYAAAMWAVLLAYFVLLSMRRSLARTELLGLGISFGLGILTKGTFFVYFPPFIAWYLLNRLVKRGAVDSVKQGALIGVIVLTLNLGFWARNIQTYGGPYGTSEWLQKNLEFDVDFFNRIFDKDQSSIPGSSKYMVSEIAMPGIYGKTASTAPIGDINLKGTILRSESQPASRPLEPVWDYLRRLAMTAGRNFTSPSGFITRQLIKFVDAYPGVFGETYGEELKASAWNHEDHAGNLHHLLLILGSIPIVLVFGLRKKDRLILMYSGSVLLTFCLIPVVIGHGASFWGVRYQLPFFVLAAPVFAYALSVFRFKAFYPLAVIFLAVASLPWLLLNSTRPVIGLPPWPTKIGSIFTESQERVLFANNTALLDDYTFTVDAIRKADCDSVGLLVGVEFLEYPLWWLLDAPQGGVWIENIIGEGESLSAYRSGREFCVVVCSQCDRSASDVGYQEQITFDTLTLFLNQEPPAKER